MNVEHVTFFVSQVFVTAGGAGRYLGAYPQRLTQAVVYQDLAVFELPTQAQCVLVRAALTDISGSGELLYVADLVVFLKAQLLDRYSSMLGHSWRKDFEDPKNVDRGLYLIGIQGQSRKFWHWL